MGVHWGFSDIKLALAMLLFSVVLKIVYTMWILPNITYLKTKRNGLSGPSPRFPLGNLPDMVAHDSKKNEDPSSSSLDSNIMSHHIHPKVFPYFAQWQQSHGKVFVYWLGTEPFLYIADPEFLKQMSSAVRAKSWGKPSVFRNDRKPMFGTYGLTMVEGDVWVRHRSVLTPAFSLPNIKALRNLMVTVTNEMLDRWSFCIKSGQQELDIESEISTTMGMIVAKTTFGMKYQNGKQVLQKLREMHQVLYTSNRYVGVPFSRFLSPTMYLKAKSIGEEIDAHFVTIINERRKWKQSGSLGSTADDLEKNLLDLMLTDHDNTKALTTKELVDECKTFFVGGHETSALALTWTLFLLAMHPEWQNQLREEIREVVGDEQVDVAMLGGLKKMGWVMSEALRLYPSAPNAQRQAKNDIHVGEVVIAKGTNIWIDLVAMHHDCSLWGDTANEFRPQRFETELYGGCKHKMGYAPFGFGGRLCIGRNLAIMEYKIVLCQILTSFSFSLSPSYSHSPAIMFSLRPSKGMLLVLQPL